MKRKEKKGRIKKKNGLNVLLLHQPSFSLSLIPPIRSCDKPPNPLTTISISGSTFPQTLASHFDRRYRNLKELPKTPLKKFPAILSGCLPFLDTRAERSIRPLPPLQL